jgi:hypothetical protein
MGQEAQKYRLDEHIEQILVHAYQRGGGLTDDEYRILCDDERTEELAGETGFGGKRHPGTSRYAISEAGALLAQAILDRNAALKAAEASR